MSAIIEMLMIFLLMAVAYYGWGRLISYIPIIGKSTTGSTTGLIWMGWAISLLILQLAHLFTPVTAYVVIPLFAVGIVFSIKPVWNSLHAFRLRGSSFDILFFAAILILSVWVSIRAMLPAMNYDAGLYYFNSIRWINSFPIVPGLGNLHARLAFNQSFFTYAAALNFYPFFGHGSSLATSFLFVLSFASFVLPLRPIYQRPSKLFDSHPFLYASALFVLPLLGFLTVYYREISSPTPDLASSLLQLNMFVMLARGVANWASGEKWIKFDAAILAILAATTVTIKLSNLAFSVVAICFCTAYTWRSATNRIKEIAGLLFPGFLIVAVWGLRGFILSGAPFFPSTIGYIPASWAMPINTIKGWADSVYAWARLPHVPPDEVLSSWDWLKPWSLLAIKDTVGTVYPIISVMVFGGIAVISTVYAYLKKKSRLRFLEWGILLLPLTGIVFWFFTAPDTRFANSIFWILAYSAALLALYALQPILSRRIFVVALVIVFVAANFLIVKYAVGRYSYKEVSLSGWQAETEAPLLQKQTSTGYIVYTPESGDQCWDAPLPCTPDFNADLLLRIPRQLGSGFYLGNSR